MESIFANTGFYKLSDPQPTWLFEVAFYNVKNNTHNTNFINFLETNLIPTSVTLPSHKTEIATKKYFGSEKSFAVLRTYGGDCTMNFDVRSNADENVELAQMTQVAAQRRDSGDYIQYHPEFESNAKGTEFHKIIIRLTNKTVEHGGDYSYNEVYELINCVITDFSFNEELNYSSDSKLTCKLTCHYDYWVQTQ